MTTREQAGEDGADAVSMLPPARTMLLLEQSEDVTAWLAVIVTSSNDAIISETPDGIITTWNPSAEQLFGYTAEDAIGQPITMLVPDDRRPEVVWIMERLARGESIAHQSTERLHKDGSRVAVSLSISPVRDATGRIVGAARVSRDLTEVLHTRDQVISLTPTDRALRQARDDADDANRRTSELYAAMRVSEARFRSLIENGSDVVIVVDGDGVVQMVSRTCPWLYR